MTTQDLLSTVLSDEPDEIAAALRLQAWLASDLAAELMADAPPDLRDRLAVAWLCGRAAAGAQKIYKASTYVDRGCHRVF